MLSPGGNCRAVLSCVGQVNVAAWPTHHAGSWLWSIAGPLVELGPSIAPHIPCKPRHRARRLTPDLNVTPPPLPPLSFHTG
jgi:hypothetical protein